MVTLEGFIMGLIVGLLIGHAIGWSRGRRHVFGVLRGRRLRRW